MKCFPCLSVKLSGECVGSNSSEACFLNTYFALCSLRSLCLLYFSFSVVFVSFHPSQLLYDSSLCMEEEYPGVPIAVQKWQCMIWTGEPMIALALSLGFIVVLYCDFCCDALGYRNRGVIPRQLQSCPLEQFSLIHPSFVFTFLLTLLYKGTHNL